MRTILAVLLLALASPQQNGDGCLLLAARNLSEGGGNFHLYYVLSEKPVEIRAGDRLRYDVFLAKGNPTATGGIDVLFDNETSLRDSGIKDSAGLAAHGDAILDAAVGAWLTRTFDLSPFAGRKTTYWDAQFEAEEKGEYVECIDNLRVDRADGTSVVIYDGGAPAASRVNWRNGYSERVLCSPVPRARVVAGPQLDALLADRKAREEMQHEHQELVAEAEAAAKFAEKEGDAAAAAEARRAASAPAPDEFSGNAAEYHELLHKQRAHLDHAHPLMQRYGGHLVGHAHIDLQWLWEWPEGLECSRATFEQVCRFMDEYPEFTFSQSSAGLYEKIEEQYPELFARMKARIKEGRFEFVGGRWCEGDTNLISGESHARHLLYGQRYFRSRFGRIATVGWEPDTFGHTAQMPQILRLGGIDSYYFCRGGKETPLFWWEGPDGSRVLAFDEPASGSWYNSDPSEHTIGELLTFYEKTGLKDLLWVYGVGNHGGGPTREQIEKVLGWQKRSARPKVTFSTARKFFDLCLAKDLEKLPVLREELNPVFRGCYTTHGDIKRLNRDAEAALTTAETIAAIATRSGFPYPAEELSRGWKEVLWNHHHDTLPGSGIHESYELSHVQLGAVIEKARWIERAAMRHLAHRVADEGAGTGVLVANPLGWSRTATVRVDVEAPAGKTPRVVDRTGAEVPSALRRSDGELTFSAADLPSFGYAVYRVVWDDAPVESPRAPAVSLATVPGQLVLENEFLRVAIDRASGELASVVDKTQPAGREVLTAGRRGNRIEAHLEAPHGMSAWNLGKIVEVIPVAEASTEPGDSGPVRASVRVKRTFRRSTITQEIALEAGARCVRFETEIDWKEKGEDGKPSPLLRVAFPVGEGSFEARYSVPFADVARPADGEDSAALTWGQLLGASGGAALLNDAKHGMSATSDGDLRLSLVRSSYDPDPAPDQFLQRVTYALAALQPGSTPAQATRLGMELAQPALAQALLHEKRNVFRGDRKGGVLESPFSLAGFEAGDGLVATALKRAESGDDLIVRCYQADAAPSARAVFRCAAESREVREVNFLEDPIGEPFGRVKPIATGSSSATVVPLRLRPYKILTLRLEGAAAREAR